MNIAGGPKTKALIKLSMPAEVPPYKGVRTLTLAAFEKAKCRTCGEEILRVSGREDNIWMHKGRLTGKAYSHLARRQLDSLPGLPVSPKVPPGSARGEPRLAPGGPRG